MSLGTKVGIMDDRRRTPRFDCPPSRESVVNFNSHPLAGRLWDLSREGLSFESSGTPELNGTYQITITDFNSAKKIDTEINVVWIRPLQSEQKFKCGARIVKMDAAEKMDLLDVLYDEWKSQITGKT